MAVINSRRRRVANPVVCALRLPDAQVLRPSRRQSCRRAFWSLASRCSGKYARSAVPERSELRWIRRWDGRARWRRFRYSKPARVQKVEVDPDRVLMLDVNSSNNSWVRQSSAPRAAKKWTAKWMIWLQNVMEFAAFFS